MALATDWAAGDPGFVAWMNSVSTLVNQNTDGTGWRNIESLMVNGYTLAASGHVRIMRRGGKVILRIRGLVGPGTGTATYVTGLPVGWRPETDTYVRTVNASGTVETFTFGAAGNLGAPVTIATSTASVLEFEWEATGSFPTSSLPGVAV